MVSPPPLIPEWFQSLSGPFPYTLNFPFIIDARITLALPASTANVILPSQVTQNSGKIKYSESYKLDKKKRFFAEANMTVDTTSISDDEAAGINVAIQNWRAFMGKYLPVQLKAK